MPCSVSLRFVVHTSFTHLAPEGETRVIEASYVTDKMWRVKKREGNSRETDRRWTTHDTSLGYPTSRRLSSSPIPSVRVR